MKKITKTTDISNTFCILPWIHLCSETNGEIKLCCSANGISAGTPDFIKDDGSKFNLNTDSINDIWNHSSMKSIRTKLLNGEKPFECSRCYDQEDKGLRSKRSWENEYWLDKIDANLILKNKEYSSNENIFYLDFKYGNKCNLKCIMCFPGASSLWIPDWKKLEPLIKNTSLEKYLNWDKEEGTYNWFKMDQFKKQIEPVLTNIQEIYFTGGEPTINKDFIDLLEKLIVSDLAKNITLRFNTNNIVYNENFMSILSKFKSVRMTISIDGLNERCEYIRYPFKWDIFLENLNKINMNKPDNVNVLYDFTVNALNVFNFPDLIKWKLQSNLDNINTYPNFGGLMGFHFLYYPKFLSIKVLPLDLKNKITNKFNELEEWIYQNYKNDEEFKNQSTGIKKIMNIVKFMNSEDQSNLFPECIKYLEIMDSIRGTNYKEVCTELKGYENG